MTDEARYTEYAVTINGKKYSIRARGGWYYTHCVALLKGGAWVVDSWHGARGGEPRRSRLPEAAAGRVVLHVGGEYSLPVP